MARFEMNAAGLGGNAAAGTVDAAEMFELGLMYAAGREVALDLIQAHKWFNLAAMRGNDAARRYRAEIAGDLTRAEIAKAQRLAREWLARR